MVNSEEEYFDFEFERRFFCSDFPINFKEVQPNLIIQSYFLSEDGYALRIRLQSSQIKIRMNSNLRADEIIDNYGSMFDMAFLTAKGPGVGGTRYEIENPIDEDVAKEMVKRAGAKTIIKNRYPVWIGKDGWVIDDFGGKNNGLIIAECERLSPVTNLEIPDFCDYEVTNDRRFSNDSLVKIPFSKFKTAFFLEFKEIMNNNSEKQFSNQFGINTIL